MHPSSLGEFQLALRGLRETWHLQIWIIQHYLLHDGRFPKMPEVMAGIYASQLLFNPKELCILWDVFCQD